MSLLDFSIKKTVDLICEILKKDVKIVTDKKRIRPIKSEVNRLISNNKKALIYAISRL